jgi:geranylgeranyl diphosphate synthase type II
VRFDRLEDFFEKHKQIIDGQLLQYIERLRAPGTLKEAMLYSVRAGGKRLRPILLLATLEAFGHNSKTGYPVACAIEMIHTYSLIHDDLPAMDDDDVRRGKPSNHKVFGEAIAILAGDGLLTYSFEIIADSEDSAVSPAMKSKLMTNLARAAGPEGMVGGQTADLEGEGKSLLLSELENIHRRKTARLLACAVEAGAILAGANAEQTTDMRQFAEHLGLAFQIRDDILDIEGNQTQMGKAPGSDSTNRKSTYPQLLTLEGTKDKLTGHVNAAKGYLHQAGIDHKILEDLTDYVVARNH